MPSTTYAANEGRIPESTLVELLFDAIGRHGESPGLRALSTPTELEDISYLGVLRIVKRVCAALEAHGISRGDRVAILSENRPEWALADYGCLCAGALDVPIYPTLTPAQIGYILEDSGARIVFASSPELVGKALQASEACGLEVDVIAFDAPPAPREGVVS
ncbi:MAG TPA: AMP-binding protein, partial [Longimicrobiales bacterium]|nr:AMP-binding protein [Longimicrobiales bacterium]